MIFRRGYIYCFGWRSAARVALSEEQRMFLARFDRHQLQGRYPDLLPEPPTCEMARAEMAQAREVFEWLIRGL